MSDIWKLLNLKEFWNITSIVNPQFLELLYDYSLDN